MSAPRFQEYAWTQEKRRDQLKSEYQWSEQDINEARAQWPRDTSPNHYTTQAEDARRRFRQQWGDQAGIITASPPQQSYGQQPGPSRQPGYTQYSYQPPLSQPLQYSQEIAHPEPKRLLTRPPFQDYNSRSSSYQAQSIPSSYFKPDPVDPKEVQSYYEDYRPLPPWPYDATKTPTNYRPPTNRPLTSTAGVSMEELQTALPGTEYIPYNNGEGAYGIWDTQPWESTYFPTGTKKNCRPVFDLWAHVWRNKDEERLCLLFDHVDFYRLAYITTTLRGTVENPNEGENTIQDIVSILNRAGRPPGFGDTTPKRPDHFTAKQVSDLFKILASRDNPHRGDAFSNVRTWVRHGNWSAKTVLRGVPEAIVEYFGPAYQNVLRAGRLRRGWLIEEFMYVNNNPDQDGPPDWVLEIERVRQSPPPDRESDPVGKGKGKRHMSSSSRQSHHQSKRGHHDDRY